MWLKFIYLPFYFAGPRWLMLEVEWTSQIGTGTSDLAIDSFHFMSSFSSSGALDTQARTAMKFSHLQKTKCGNDKKHFLPAIPLSNMPGLLLHPPSLTPPGSSPGLRLQSEQLSHWSKETGHGDLTLQWHHQIIEPKLTDTFHKWPLLSATAALGRRPEFCTHHPLCKTVRYK